MKVFYIGIGSRPDRPYSKDRSEPWKKYVAKHGDPVVEIVLTGACEVLAKAVEVFLVGLYGRKSSGGDLVNITAGGDSQPMRMPEIVARVSAAQKGRVFSDATRKKMSDAKIGRPMPEYLRDSLKKRLMEGWHPMRTPGAKEKLSASIKGIKRSAEHCRKNGEAHSREVSQYTLDGVLVARHKSLRDAANIIGCTSSAIGMVCRGKSKSAKGFVWRYSDGGAAGPYKRAGVANSPEAAVQIVKRYRPQLAAML